MEIVNVLDELIGPLYHHIANLMTQPVDGTDAKRELVQTKKGVSRRSCISYDHTVIRSLRFGKSVDTFCFTT